MKNEECPVKQRIFYRYVTRRQEKTCRHQENKHTGHHKRCIFPAEIYRQEQGIRYRIQIITPRGVIISMTKINAVAITIYATMRRKSPLR
jgi:hypothetical protein